MKGIDVSNNNGVIDFTQVKNTGIEVVYIKASEGVSFVDPYVVTNYNNAKAAGLKVGFYHFLKKNNPVSQAQHFLQTVQGLEADCLYICDVEGDWNICEATEAVKQFTDYLLSQGKQVGIYTGDYFYRDNLSSSVKDLPLWVASYGKEPMCCNYAGWQYSESGSISGITGHVDLNEFNESILLKGDEKELKNIVCVNNGVDERAGEYLADFLGCPIVNLATTNASIDYSKVENVYFVGGGAFPTINNSKVIKGNDRYDTCIEVMKNIGKLK